MADPDNLVLQLLRDMRSEMVTKRDIADVRSEVADVHSEITSLRADVASDMLTLEKRLSDQFVGLRRP